MNSPIAAQARLRRGGSALALGSVRWRFGRAFPPASFFSVPGGWRGGAECRVEENWDGANLGLLQSQRNGWQQAEKVLALLATYRPSDFQAALERAVRYGAFSLSAVQRILAVQAQPKSCLEPLAEQATEQFPDALRTPATPPRPPADYQPLLFPEKASPI